MNMIEYGIRGCNWVTYNGRLYKQEQEIPMGSPASTKYAEIYMDHFKTLYKGYEGYERGGNE